MNHIVLLAYAAAFITGISSLTLTSIVTFRTKSRDLRYLLLLFFSYAMDMFHIIVDQYFRTNLPEATFHNWKWFYISSMFFHYFLLFCILFLGGYLILPQKKGLGFLAAVPALCCFVVDVFIPEFGHLPFLGTAKIPDIVFFGSILAIAVLGLINLKQIDGHFLWLIKRILIVLVIFFPFLLNDDLMVVPLPLRISPLVFTLISVLILVYVLRYYLKEYYLSDREIDLILPGKSSMENPLDAFGFSEREKEIIQQVLKGASNKTIGEALFISLSTVKSHVYNIFKKAGVTNRYELMHLVKNGPSGNIDTSKK